MKEIYLYFVNFMKSTFPSGGVYVSNNIPDSVPFPYLTYENVTAFYGDEQAAVTVAIWDYTESEKGLNDAVKALRRYIDDNPLITCENGGIWVKPASPFAQGLKDEANINVRGRYINLMFEFFTGA